MKTKKLFFIMIFALAVVISAAVILAENADYCCEKTTSNAWCQNAPKTSCDSKFRSTPTSCDATSFCKGGCCYDSNEGLCMENTPQIVCNNKNGTWSDSEDCSIPQCELGCCVLDNQAAFVTLTRCKKLSGFFGLETDFRTGVANEVECIGLTQASDRGACVYEEEFTKTCKFTTREECKGVSSTGNMTAPEFYKDYLCSAEELGTNCGPTSQTTCIPGRDEVYFKDSCGNPANVYDASKLNDKSYWQKIIGKAQSCGTGKSNANSKTCGNCDYSLGSMCKASTTINRAAYGNNICKDLNCYGASDGKDHRHGESWCSYDGNTGKGVDAVGSRQVRHICVAGEELVEPCADFRQEVCLESKTDTGNGIFTESACRVNRWQDCTRQTEKKDCENTDKRDCFWIAGVNFVQTTEANTGQTQGVAGLITGESGACVPNVPPGEKFWDEGATQGECSIASSQCVVTYKQGLLGGKECISNCQCLDPSWAEKMNQVCSAVGDCGADVNWIGNFTQDGADWKTAQVKNTLSQSIINNIKSKAGAKAV